MSRTSFLTVGWLAAALCAACGNGGGAGDGGVDAGVDPDSLWELLVESAALETTDPTGASWDVGGGAPDPQVCLTVGTTARWCTAVVQDNVNATWNETGPETYRHAALADVRVELLDDDIPSAQVVADFNTGLQAATNAASSQTLTPDTTPAGWTELRVTVSPAP